MQQQEIEFSDLLNRNFQTINGICLRYCGGNAFYFDELRQECALAIWFEFSRYDLDRFRGDSAESTWIYQISYHAIIDYFRNLLDHYLSDDSYSTIARTEGITESNARKRMSRLLNKLKMLIHK